MSEQISLFRVLSLTYATLKLVQLLHVFGVQMLNELEWLRECELTNAARGRDGIERRYIRVEIVRVPIRFQMRTYVRC